MTNAPPPATTLLRVFAIAGITFLVGTLVVTYVFLSSGNESELLPPWQLVAAEVVSVSFLAFLSLHTSHLHTGRAVFAAAIAIAIGLTALFAIFWGLGHTWSSISAVGKGIAAFLTLAYPIILAATVIIMMRNRSVSLTTIWAASIVLCLVFSIPIILVGMVLACGLTGDCL